MALLQFGLDMYVRNFASYLTRTTRIESNTKRMSKAFVDGQTDVYKASLRRLSLIRQEEESVRTGVALTKKQLSDRKKEIASLKLMNAEMAKTRKARALDAAETGKQAREYIGLAFALGVVAVALAKFNSANLKATLGAEKSTLALEVLTENMGISRDAIEDEITELRELLLTRTEAERMTARFANAELDLSQASDAALAAMRLSTLGTVKRAKAVELVTNAIVRQRPRQLQQLDVSGRLKKMIDEFAEGMEVEGKLLTESERSRAILNFVIEQSNNLRGLENDYLKTGTGLLDSYNTQIKDLQRTLGDALLPSYIEVLKVANDFLAWLNELPTPIKNAVSELAALVGVITAVGTSIVTAVAVAKVAGFTIAAAALTAALPWVGLALVIGAVVLELSHLIGKIKEIRGLKIAPVEDVAKSIQAQILESLIKDTLEELDLRIRQIDVDLSLIEKSFERQRLKAQLILIPLQQQEKQVQRLIVLWQRLTDVAVGFAERPLKFAQAVLDSLADISKDLDKDLLPYEFALRRVEASAGRILIPLRAQERSLQRQLDLLQRRIALERKSLENVLRAAELSLRGIEDQVYALDKVLWPLQDAFTQISADADLVLIPLRRQRREIERQIDRMERLSEIEQKRIERHLRALEKQRDALQDIIDADRKRLDIINHEIFMEQQRNRILQRVTSARFLTMQSQAAVMQDQLALRQEEAKVLSEQTKDERERLQDIKDVLDEQLEPLRERLQMLVDAITLEEDRVTFARENLRLEEARQASARIALEQQRRLAEEEVEQAQRRLEAFDELAEQRTRALEDELLAIGDIIFREEERIEIERARLELARLGQTEARIALEKAISLWEDRRDAAQAHLDKVKETYELVFTALKGQLTKIQDIIFEVERELQLMKDIKDQVEATLKLRKEQYEWDKKRLDVLEKIQDVMNDKLINGGTTGGAATPTVPAPVQAPTPPVIILPTGTPGPTIQVEAHYSDTQSVATIKDDIELMMSYAR